MATVTNMHLSTISKQGSECHYSIENQTFSFPSPFQRYSNSKDPDYLSLDDLYRSDLGEPHPSGSLCCDDAEILSKSQHTHTAIITYQQYTTMCTACVAQDYTLNIGLRQASTLVQAVVQMAGSLTVAAISHCFPAVYTVRMYVHT